MSTETIPFNDLWRQQISSKTVDKPPLLKKEEINELSLFEALEKIATLEKENEKLGKTIALLIPRDCYSIVKPEFQVLMDKYLK